MNPSAQTNTNNETLEQLMSRLEQQGTQRATQLMSSAYARTLPSITYDGNPSQVIPRTPTPRSGVLTNEINTNANTTLENKLEKSILNTVKNIPQKSILGIMKEGEAELVKQTGRHMTYSEMRQLYG